MRRPSAAFRAIGDSRSVLPFRQRPIDNSVYVRFADLWATRAVEVFVRTDVISSMRGIADRAWPHEAIGLLAGRACRDVDGIYTIVDAVEPATSNECEATPGSVHLSASGFATLRRRLAHQHPALDPIGWYHSHPHSDAFYSSEDRTEQSTWADPYNVGIVVGERLGRSTVNVYTGPHAYRVAQITLNGTEPAASTRRSLEGRPDRVSTDRDGRPKIHPHLLLLALTLTVAVCFAIVVLLFLRDRFRYAQDVTSRSVSPALAPAHGEAEQERP